MLIKAMKITRSVNSDELRIETIVSLEYLANLRTERLLCGAIKYEKEKYKFYKQLSDALSEEILIQLIEKEEVER